MALKLIAHSYSVSLSLVTGAGVEPSAAVSAFLPLPFFYLSLYLLEVVILKI